MNATFVEDFGPPITIRVLDCLICEAPAPRSRIYILPLGSYTRFRYSLCRSCIHRLAGVSRYSLDAYREEVMGRLLLVSDEMSWELRSSPRLH